MHIWCTVFFPETDHVVYAELAVHLLGVRCTTVHKEIWVPLQSVLHSFHMQGQQTCTGFGELMFSKQVSRGAEHSMQLLSMPLAKLA